QVQLAVAHLMLDDLDTARRVLPDRSASSEGQDRVDQLWAEMRLGLDSGQPLTAAETAEEVLRGHDWPLRVQLYLSDMAAEAFLAAGRRAEAATLLERMEAAGARPDHPWLLRMRGRVAAAGDRHDEALRDLRQAAETFRTAGFRHEESRSRLALAGVLAEGGEVEAAQAE